MPNWVSKVLSAVSSAGLPNGFSLGSTTAWNFARGTPLTVSERNAALMTGRLV